MKRCLIGMATALVVSLAPMAALAAAPVRVMSYNIRYDNPDDRPNWGDRQGTLLAQIRFTAPDILGVQEALPHMLADLARGLPLYGHYGKGRNDGVQGESTAIFYSQSRFEPVSAETHWCSPTPDRPSKAEGAGEPRIITRLVLKDREDGALYDVRNVHFDNVSDRARTDCARQVASIPAAAGAHTLVLGDLNSGPSGGAYRLLAQGSGLRDARTISPILFGPEGTFNDFDIHQTGPALDHIFVDAGLGVARFATLTDSINGQVISDHYPLVADVIPAGR